MRTPIRSEPGVFRLTLAGAVLVGASLLIGWLIEPLAGVVVFAVVVAVAVVALIRTCAEPRPSHGASRRRARAPSPAWCRRGEDVLVVANETLSGDDLRERIAGSGRRARHGRRARAPADVACSLRRLGHRSGARGGAGAPGTLAGVGARARHPGTGRESGDPSTSTAIADELRRFGADEVIVVTHPRERQSWQERGELERLRSELDVPVVHPVQDDRVGS